MNNIKKSFAEMATLLEANKAATVESIMPQLLALMTSKAGVEKAFHMEGTEVVAIYCYYHKVWELVSAVEYGAKKSSKTGLNTMCKVGVSKWTKQQNKAKADTAQLMADVTSGVVEASLLATKMAEIDAAKKAIVDVPMVGAFDNLDEALTEYALLNATDEQKEVAAELTVDAEVAEAKAEELQAPAAKPRTRSKK